MTQQKIVDQMNAWDNEDCETKPDDTAPHGQKCLYKVSLSVCFQKCLSCTFIHFQHTGSEGTTTYGTHTTPIQRYVDDLTFNFQALDNGGCFIDVRLLKKVNKTC